MLSHWMLSLKLNAGSYVFPKKDGGGVRPPFSPPEASPNARTSLHSLDVFVNKWAVEPVSRVQTSWFRETNVNVWKTG
jgi:hypothetical protein